jgi:hypothetical protein
MTCYPPILLDCSFRKYSTNKGMSSIRSLRGGNVSGSAKLLLSFSAKKASLNMQKYPVFSADTASQR